MNLPHTAGPGSDLELILHTHQFHSRNSHQAVTSFVFFIIFRSEVTMSILCMVLRLKALTPRIDPKLSTSVPQDELVALPRLLDFDNWNAERQNPADTTHTCNVFVISGLNKSMLRMPPCVQCFPPALLTLPKNEAHNHFDCADSARSAGPSQKLPEFDNPRQCFRATGRV